jgi:hypothetical protein
LVPWKRKIILREAERAFWYLGKGKSYVERQKVLFWYLGKGKSCFIILKNAFMPSYNVKIQFDSVEK